MMGKNNFIIVSLIIFLYNLWFRFVREHLPRDIPFSLSLSLCIIIIILCLLYYLKIINSLRYYFYLTDIKPSISFFIYKKQKDKFIVFYQILHKILEPLIIFDKVLKNNKVIKKIIKKLLKYYLGNFNYNQNILFQKVTFFFFTQVYFSTLSIIFFIEVFFYKRILFSYMLIPFLIIPLSFNYILYTITTTLEEYIQFLEHNYLVKITSKIPTENENDPYLHLSGISWDYQIITNFEEIKQYIKLRRFLFFHTDEIITGYKPYDYDAVITWDFIKHNKPEFIKNNILLDDPEDVLPFSTKKT